MDIKLHGAFFTRVTDTTPQFFDLEWEAFATFLRLEREVRADKDGPLFSMARFQARDIGKGQGLQQPVRKNDFVTELSAMVLDIDEWAPGTNSDALLAKLRGTEYVAYTSFSHMVPGADKEGVPHSGIEKIRIVLPLEHPVPAKQYKAAYTWLRNSLQGFKFDDTAAAISRAFYLPSSPAEYAHLAWTKRGEGSLLTLPAFTDLKKGVPSAALLSSSIDWIWLKQRMRAYDKDPELRKAFLAVLRGESFGRAPGSALPGNRDSTLTRMCGVLAGWALKCEPSELAAVFAMSLSRMAQEEPDDLPPDLDNAADKIARAQSSMLAAMDRAASEAEPEFATKVRPGGRAAVTALPVVETGVAPDEEGDFDALARARGLQDGEDLRQHLILMKGDHVWLWRASERAWGTPMREREAQAAIARYWQGLPGVYLYRRNTDGSMRPRQLNDLIRSYGFVMKGARADFTIDAPYFDARSEHLVEVGAPRRELEPAFHPIVDMWLRALGGEKHEEQVLDWVATVKQLKLPNAALYLHGASDVGKGLLVRGLSRIWDTDGATNITSIIRGFNADLRRCPLVVIDEGTWDKWADTTTKLRELITENTRSVNEKFKPTYEVSGHLRFILTANNFNLFANNPHSLTPNDRKAIADRFLEVHPSTDATAILMSLDREERDDLAGGNHIAAHALWLERDRKVKTNGRYLVPGGGDTSQFASRIITEDKRWGTWVAEWLTHYLSDPLSVERDGSNLVWRGGGRVIVSPEAVIRTWPKIMQNGQRPMTAEISNVLRSLSSGVPVDFPTGKGRGFEIRTGDILRFAMEKVLGNIEVMVASINGERGPALAPVVGRLGAQL